MSYGKEIIYHYTSLLGLYGIIGSRYMRFGEFRNSNDPRERLSLSDFRYISFTEDGAREGWANPLMWYVYAKGYDGVCIGFDKNRILQLNKEIVLEHFHINYEDDKNKLPSIHDKSIEPAKYKLRCWIGENEYRFATNNKTAVLKIDLNCIEHIYFKNRVTCQKLKPEFEALLTVGLGSKMVNIGFEDGEVRPIPIQRIAGVSHFKLHGKIYVPLIGEELMTEDEIYSRCNELYKRFVDKPCISCHEKLSPTLCHKSTSNP